MTASHPLVAVRRAVLSLTGLLVVTSVAPVAAAAVDLYRSYPVMKYGDSVAVDCLAVTSFNNTEFRYWLFPDLTVVNTSTGNDVIIGSGNYSINIPYLRARHTGDYFCHAVTTTVDRRPVYSRATIYLYRPTVWQEYKVNIITGLLAAAGCLIVSTSFCIVTSLPYFRHLLRGETLATIVITSGPAADGHVTMQTTDVELPVGSADDIVAETARKDEVAMTDFSSTAAAGCSDKKGEEDLQTAL